MQGITSRIQDLTCTIYLGQCRTPPFHFHLIYFFISFFFFFFFYTVALKCRSNFFFSKFGPLNYKYKIGSAPKWRIAILYLQFNGPNFEEKNSERYFKATIFLIFFFNFYQFPIGIMHVEASVHVFACPSVNFFHTGLNLCANAYHTQYISWYRLHGPSISYSKENLLIDFEDKLIID